MSALPRTWKTNRCVAYVSEPAWRAAGHKLSPDWLGPQAQPDPIPTGWCLAAIQEDPASARAVLLFEGSDAEWTLAEFTPLPVIGCFGLDGDTSAGVVSAQAADLHAALLKLFTRETEGEPSRP